MAAELAELGDDMDPDDIDGKLADIEARLDERNARDLGPNHPADRPRVGTVPGGDGPPAPVTPPAKPLPDPGLFQRPCPAHLRRPTDPWRCVLPGCPGSHWAHGSAP